jgi:hypothetical protein
MTDPRFFRKYLDILNEGPPPGVGPNAVRKAPAQQQLGQPDTFTKMLPGMGNKAIDAGKGLVNPYAKTMSNFTPGSEYYQKNVANNPQAKAQVDAFMKTAPTASDLGAGVDATKQSFNKALTQKPMVGGTSAEYEKAAGQLGMPAVPQPQTPTPTKSDSLDEGPPPGVGPNAPAKPAAPVQSKWTAKDEDDFQTWSAADRTQRELEHGTSDQYAPGDPRAHMAQAPVKATMVHDQGTRAVQARAQDRMNQAGGSPERQQQFVQRQIAQDKQMRDLEAKNPDAFKPDGWDQYTPGAGGPSPAPAAKPTTPAAKPAPTTPTMPTTPVQEEGDDELQKLKEFLNKKY